MMPAKNAIQTHDTRAQESFRIFPDGRGHWCARKSDGMVAGVFFNRDAALRFADNESTATPALQRNAPLDGDIAMTQAPAPKSFKVRRAAILAQLAFVGFLLIGRVAAGVVDASVMPTLDTAIISDSSQAGSMNP
jgi:hypothetical protein